MLRAALVLKCERMRKKEKKNNGKSMKINIMVSIAITDVVLIKEAESSTGQPRCRQACYKLSYCKQQDSVCSNKSYQLILT
jgi:hypothetical protein